MTTKIKRLDDYTIDIQIVGTSFRDKQTIHQIHQDLKFHKSHDVKFRYQTENKADPNAIMVFVNGLHLGYIPKEFCETFKQTMFKWKIVKRTAYMICGCHKKINDSYHIVITVAKR